MSAPAPSPAPVATSGPAEPARVVKGVSLWADARKRLLRNHMAVAGLVVIALVSLSAVLAPLVTPDDPELQRFWMLATPPGSAHPDVRETMVFRLGESLDPRGVPPAVAGLGGGTHELSVDLRRITPVEHRVVCTKSGRVVTVSRTTGAEAITQVAAAGPGEYFRQIGSDGHPILRADGGPLEIRDATIAKGADLPAEFTRPAAPEGRFVIVVEHVVARVETATVRFATGTVAALAVGAGGATPSAVPALEFNGRDVSAIRLDGRPLTRSHVLGTDRQGRDVLARIIFGGRISLLIALLATAVSLSIGIAYGAISGYAGGTLDTVMMRIVDILYGLPYIFLVIILMVTFGKDIMVLFIALGAVQWLTMARIVRGQILSLKEKEFVEAARMGGAGAGAIVFRHLVPNVLGIVAVYTTLTIPAVVLQESFLAFIGLGVQYKGSNLASWGTLVKEGMDSLGEGGTNWWLLIYPSLVMSTTLFAFNFVGDGLRDALDPQQKGRT